MSAKMVYAVIQSYSWDQRPCMTSTKTLCEDSGVGRTAFFAAIRLLSERGLILVQKRPYAQGHVNHYTPIPTGVGVPNEGSSESVLPDPRTGGVVRQAAEGSSPGGHRRRRSEEDNFSPSSLRSEGNARAPEDSPGLFDHEETAPPSPKRRTVTYRGVKASPEQVDKALGALAVFNELKSGRAISPWTGTKHPSEQFKQIVGQVLDHPEVTADEWEQVVRNVFTNPPSWCAEKGTPPCIGDIFGPKAMGYALENNGVARRELSSGGQRRPKVSDFAAQLLGGGRSE